MIVPGAVIQIYPGPAIYPLVRSRLSERQVQALLRRAARAGLLARGAIDYGTVGVSDMPTTTLLVNAGGKHLERAAYALGATAGGNGLSAAQARARQALARFIAGLPHGLSGALYAPRAIAVYVGPATGPAQPGATRIVWPLKRNLATRRDTRLERARLPLHLRRRHGREGAAGQTAQGERAVSVDDAGGSRQELRADREAVAPGRARLRLASAVIFAVVRQVASRDPRIDHARTAISRDC